MLLVGNAASVFQEKLVASTPRFDHRRAHLGECLEKLPEKEKPFFSFGKSLHSALEFLYKDQGLLFPSLEELLKTYEQVWLTKGYESPESEENYKAEGRQILTEYYEKNKAVFRRPLAVEHQFNLEVSGIKVIGFIDRIDKVAGDRLSIVDYKTGKEITRKRAATDPQLTMYQMACEQDFGLKADSLIFYHLNSQTPVTSGPHSEEQVRSLRENIVRVGTAIQKAIAADDNGRDFKPDPGEPKCNWCDFRPHCPVWAHQYAKKAPPAAPPPPVPAGPARRASTTRVPTGRSSITMSARESGSRKSSRVSISVPSARISIRRSASEESPAAPRARDSSAEARRSPSRPKFPA